MGTLGHLPWHWPGDGALSSSDTKDEGEGKRERSCECGNAVLPCVYYVWHSPAREITHTLYPMGITQKQNRNRCDEQGSWLCVKAMTIPGSFSYSILVLASPVSPTEVNSSPQILPHYLHNCSNFIRPLSWHHPTGSSCSVAHSVWFSQSSCSICSI